MADRSSRRGGRAPRDRRGGGGYRDDRDRDHDRRRYDDEADDRDNRRRYRSRSRDRDAGRLNRDRERDRDSRRDRSRSRDRPRRDGGAPRDRGGRGDRGDRGDRDGHDSRRTRDRGGRIPRGDGTPKSRDDQRRRSASPRRSTSPGIAELPTRSKNGGGGGDRSSAQPSMSIRVNGEDGETDGRGHHDRENKYQDERQEDDRSIGGDEAEPMDEDEDVEVEDDGLGDMAAMMGFGGFGSTKGKKIVGNNVGAIRKEKKTEYRQYMNRVGGFNRPLSPGR